MGCDPQYTIYTDADMLFTGDVSMSLKLAVPRLLPPRCFMNTHAYLHKFACLYHALLHGLLAPPPKLPPKPPPPPHPYPRAGLRAHQAAPHLPTHGGVGGSQVKPESFPPRLMLVLSERWWPHVVREVPFVR